MDTKTLKDIIATRIQAEMVIQRGYHSCIRLCKWLMN